MRSPLLRRFVLLPFVVLALIALLATGTALAGKDKEKDKGWLGITMMEVSSDLAEAMDMKKAEGVLINSVIEDSPADEAGLEDGDVITEFNGKKIEESEDLSYFVGKTKPGDKVKVKVLRDGKSQTFDVVIGERQKDAYAFAWSDKEGKNFDIRAFDDGNVWVYGDDDDDVHRIITRIHGDHGYMGVHLDDMNEQLGEYFEVKDGKGALITEVVEDSPAAQAGLKAGDVIIQIGDEKIADSGDVTKFMANTEEGDEAQIKVMRKGKDRTITVTLAETPEDFAWHSGKDMKIMMSPGKHHRRHVMPEMEFEMEHEGMEELKEELDELREELQQLKKELQKG